MTNKRKIFLEIFLTALGAEKIEWGKLEVDKIFGTVVYDSTDAEERQDFVWHMTEDKVPSEEVKMVIKYIADNSLIKFDKIIKPVEELNLDFIEQSKRKKVIDELFNIEVRMIDEGEESDRYFIHD